MNDKTGATWAGWLPGLVLALGLALVPATVTADIGSLPAAGRTQTAVEQNIQNTGEIFSKPDNQPQLSAEVPAAPAAGAGGTAKVLVEDFVFTGDILFPVDSLAQVLAGYRGRQLSMDDLNQAAYAVSQYYAQHGYVITQAYLPPQELTGGKVTIAVVVARYGQITVDNQVGLPVWLVDRELSGIRPGEYIYKPDLDRAMLFINDLSGIDCRGDLKAGSQAGTSDLILTIVAKPRLFSTMLSFDNYGNVSTGRNEGTLGLNWYNLTGRGDGLSVNWLTTSDSLNSGSLSYVMPFGGVQGATLAFSYSTVYYTLGEQFSSLDYLGQSNTAALTWNLPIERSREGNRTLSITYNFKDLTNNIRAYSLVNHSHVSEGYVTYSGNYYDQIGLGGYNSYSLTASWGTLNLSGSSESIDQVTAQTEGGYGMLVGSWQRDQVLSDRWQLHINLSGQWASKNLNGSEEFVLTGPYGVRAWPQGEYSGDEGWLGSAEFKYVFPAAGSLPGQFSWALFYDAGGVVINKNPWPQFTSDNTVTLQGWGTGLIWQDPENQWYLRADVAWKLSGPPSTSMPDAGQMYWLKLVKMM
ncbi:MAG: hypothetical protein N3A57_05045 [Negativicutes bacterium]|nr:hypothetical protein [Negativicutes bacterium]